MGVQSLDDSILALNQRGHTVAQTHQAWSCCAQPVSRLSCTGCPTCLGATPESDRQDFSRLWDGLCPDEIKIYPNQLLENTDLYACWLRGEYQPIYHPGAGRPDRRYQASDPALLPGEPRHPRHPSTYVVEGNKRTSLRQDVQEELRRRGVACSCVRCREVRGRKVDPGTLVLHDLVYQAADSQEHFLSFDTQDDNLAGFLRLSLPGPEAPSTGLTDLEGAPSSAKYMFMVSHCRWGATKTAPPSTAGWGDG